MSKTRTKRWDAVEHLKSDEEMAAYLEAALEDGDPALVAAALGDIARAKGMAEIARQAGLGPETPYKPAFPRGNTAAWGRRAVGWAPGPSGHATPGLDERA